MLTFPSARRLLLPATAVLLVLVFLRLLSDFGLLRSSHDALLQAALERYLQGSASAKITVLDESTHPHLFTSASYSPPPHANPIPEANALIRRFTSCPSPVNPYTGHVRLENQLLNISLVPASSPDGQRKREDDEDHGRSEMENAESDKPRFFNPAIVPLPYWAHPVKYVLVSRMVTAGFHQESHICLADMCLPPPAPPSASSPSQDLLPRTQPNPSIPLPPDARPCTSSDTSQLSSRGGLRCLTPAVKINIPSTPAENCTGAWLAFPDIPGFHDPRVFWSGKGEPLILVNSASRYACVGLWIVDLRKIYPLLESVLRRDGQAKKLGAFVRRDGSNDDGKQLETSEGGMHEGLARGFAPSVSYPHLTEITRNPRYSRASVEKNWVLWFPTHEDAYVQYDLLGHAVRDKDEDRLEVEKNFEGLARLGLGGNYTDGALNANMDNITGPGTNATLFSGRKRSPGTDSGRKWGRTFAKLTGNGFTTPNLTHPNEHSCLSTAEGHFEDSLGNVGHWHQGSNSLRLVLCTRVQTRADPACREDDNADEHRNGSDPLNAVDSGRSVHFAIMHRKFSNLLDLPLRYERYVVVWEGREPFQILGMSRFPLLMKNEWAKPWTEAENWPNSMEAAVKGGWNATGRQSDSSKRRQVVRGSVDEPLGQGEEFEKSSAYFSYTPSLAWAWRPHSTTANEEDEKDEAEYMSELGIGYLGDDVLVGIGLDDMDQAFVRVQVENLLQCLRLCPGVTIAGEDAE